VSRPILVRGSTTNKKSSYCECGKPLDTGYNCKKCTPKIEQLNLNKRVQYFDLDDFNVKNNINSTGFHPKE